MERPAWMLIVLSSLTPKELSDYAAILILELASVQATVLQAANYSIFPMFAIIPAVSLLAALSHDSRKERRELAFIAYGGRNWQIHLRYFLQGTILTGIGIVPIIVWEFLTLDNTLAIGLITGLLMTGAAFYSVPSLRRVSSLEFVGRYKR